MSSLAIGAAYLGMAVSRELWLACAFSVVGGLGNGVQWVSVMTALQESTPDDLQARITGLLESLTSATTGVGFLLGGADHGDHLSADRVRGVRHRGGPAGRARRCLPRDPERRGRRPQAGYTSTITGSTIGRRLSRP